MPARILLALILGMLVLPGCQQDEPRATTEDREKAKAGYTYSILGVRKQLEGKGKYLEVAIVTQTPDMSTCHQVHQNKIDLMKTNSFWEMVEGECDDRASTNSLMAGVFNNEPAMKLYLSFKDLEGFEMRVNFMGATVPAARALADMVIPEFLRLGIQDIRIIEPAP